MTFQFVRGVTASGKGLPRVWRGFAALLKCIGIGERDFRGFFFGWCFKSWVLHGLRLA